MIHRSQDHGCVGAVDCQDGSALRRGITILVEDECLHCGAEDLGCFSRDKTSEEGAGGYFEGSRWEGQSIREMKIVRCV